MFYKRKTCICCNSEKLIEILDLHDQPLANSYHTETETLDSFPLKLNLCTNCYHLQLSHIVNPDYLFKNYLYVSGTTKTLKDYFDWFAGFSTEYHSSAKSVLDIACNDGTQLTSFQKFGLSTYGIDPAENLYKLSSQNHNVVCDYFSKKHFEGTTFDIIVAQNVCAHTEHAKSFLEDCSAIMNDDSVLFIQTSQAEMVKNNQFDTIYHEHVSFFNINSFNELAKRTPLHLIDVIKSPIHGTSYIFVLSKQNRRPYLIQNLIALERSQGLFDMHTYIKYKTNVKDIVTKFVTTIEEHRKNNYKIVGYGAAAKGNTLLNFANVKLDYVIDDNKLKQGLLTPGTNISIVSVDVLKDLHENDKVLFVPLAWNFFDEIRVRIKNVRNNPNDVYLKYFPSVTIES